MAAAPEPEPMTVGVSLDVDALFARPWYGDLMRAARTLAPERPEAAIALAHMGVEVYVELSLSELLRKQGMSEAEIQAEMDALPGFNLRWDGTKDYWRELTGDAIQQAAAWSAYIEAVKLRNLVVHRGQRASPKEAADSVQRCTGLILHMQTVLRTVL